jgi:murein DD-endopeptidase MepM/ murein hydrolase activator NlpD
MWFSIVAACVSLFFPPVNGVVVRSYQPPSCLYCAGHRGMSVAVINGSPVRAIANGIVTFAGEVGGNVFVVLQFAPDLRLTYGYLIDRAGDGGVEVSTGDIVARGAVLGHTSTRVYLGVRRGQLPVNPAPYVSARRARLVLPATPICGIRGSSR